MWQPPNNCTKLGFGGCGINFGRGCNQGTLAYYGPENPYEVYKKSSFSATLKTKGLCTYLDKSDEHFMRHMP